MTLSEGNIAEYNRACDMQWTSENSSTANGYFLSLIMLFMVFTCPNI